jgi:hypothetical protein
VIPWSCPDARSAAHDVDGPSLAYELASAPSHGTASCARSGECTYSPELNFAGTDSFVVQVGDGTAVETGTVSVTVRPVNDPPVADDLAVGTTEDAAVTFGLPISDVDDTVIEIEIVDAPVHGVVSCDTTCTYTPNSNHFGGDSFGYQVIDRDGASDRGWVDVVVHPVNDHPVALPVDLSTDEDTAVDVPLEGTDVENDPLTSAVSSGPGHGSAISTGNQVATYTPALNFHGSDFLEFEVADGSGATARALATITVRPVNDAPVAEDLEVNTDEDVAVTFGVPVGDVDGDGLVWAVVDGPAHGQITRDGGNFTYTPDRDTDVHGVDDVVLRVTDSEGAADDARVTIHVAPVNDAPAGHATGATTDEDQAVDVTLLAGDVDGDELIYTIDAAPEHGTLDCTAAGVCVYEPDADFFGSDIATFTATDPEGASSSAMLMIDVRPVNDAPVAVGGAITTGEDAPVAVLLQGSDIDGDMLTFAAARPAQGSITCADRVCTYTPAADFHGSDVVDFTVTDSGGLTDRAAIDVTVRPVNDATLALDLEAEGVEDTPLAFWVPASDVDGDDLTFEFGSPAKGTLSGTAPDLVYQPEPNAFGADTFTYTVLDGKGGSATATVSFAVAEVNDAPVAADGNAANENQPSVSFTLGAVDSDEDPVSFAVTTPPTHGAATCSAAGVCIYVPEPAYSGTDSLVFTASDGRGGTDTGTVTITVTPGTPQAQLEALIDKAMALGGHDLRPDPTTQLRRAIERLDAGQRSGACGQLTAAGSQIESAAQRNLTPAQQAELIAGLRRIREHIGC